MPKLKTNRSATKRYRITKNNKVIRRKAFKSHILEKKLPKQKRRLSKKVTCCKGDSKVIIKYLVK